MTDNRILELKFAADTITLGADDIVIMAVPARQAATLLNAHFRCTPPPSAQSILGVVGGLPEWIFAFENRLSVTISYADHLMTAPREELALKIWQDV